MPIWSSPSTASAGHSSRPYGGTSLGRLSGAIADITRAPFAVRLNSAMTGAFETLAPYITQEPLKTLVQDVAGNADAIAACCMGRPTSSRLSPPLSRPR